MKCLMCQHTNREERRFCLERLGMHPTSTLPIFGLPLRILMGSKPLFAANISARPGDEKGRIAESLVLFKRGAMFIREGPGGSV